MKNYSYPTIDFFKRSMALIDSIGQDYDRRINSSFEYIFKTFYLNFWEVQMKSRKSNRYISLYRKKHSMFDLSPGSLCEISLMVPLKLIIENNTNVIENVINNFRVDNLIIFIHGGEFVSLSHKSYPPVLSEILKAADCSILNVKYTKSPKASFGQIIHECFYVYCWAVLENKIFSQQSCKKKIILMGDSSGANLVVGVMQKIIKKGIYIPNGLVLIYPTLNMVETLSPSRLLSFIDPCLSLGNFINIKNCYLGKNFNKSKYHTSNCSTIQTNYTDIHYKNMLNFLLMFYRDIGMPEKAIQFYANSNNNCLNLCHLLSQKNIYKNIVFMENDIAEHPKISPLRIPSNILRHFPPVRFILTNTDPLLDDGIEFAKRLLNSGVDVKVEILKGFPRGFLQYYFVSDQFKIALDVIKKILFDLWSRK
ncbi:hypothetical protein HZS_6763 [Henneguya salminicola]|nr:hypothetical protein HZS_6763 [Henneguya salminicola]